MSVKRYYWDRKSDCDCEIVEQPDGAMVDYDQHASVVAALEARCAALAAELQSVKAMNDCLSEELRGYESDGAFEGPKMHLLWWQCETPNHDAFLAEVRASGAEMFAAWNDKHIKPGVEHKESLTAVSHAARWFAELLRKGVQS